jgi:uncharacterized membrane protein YhaH (DUF805 family)
VLRHDEDGMDWRAYLFSFKGRVNRVAYWRLAILSGLFVAVLFAGSYVLASAGLPAWLPLLLLPFLLVPAVSVPVKRLHDRNKSGWWLLVFSGAPFALNGVVEWWGDDARKAWAVLAAALTSLGLSIWGLVEIGFLRGTPGPNRYGEPV